MNKKLPLFESFINENDQSKPWHSYHFKPGGSNINMINILCMMNVPELPYDDGDGIYIDYSLGNPYYKPIKSYNDLINNPGNPTISEIQYRLLKSLIDSGDLYATMDTPNITHVKKYDHMVTMDDVVIDNEHHEVIHVFLTNKAAESVTDAGILITENY
jgi:hypothetical protein